MWSWCMLRYRVVPVLQLSWIRFAADLFQASAALVVLRHVCRSSIFKEGSKCSGSEFHLIFPHRFNPYVLRFCSLQQSIRYSNYRTFIPINSTDEEMDPDEEMDGAEQMDPGATDYLQGVRNNIFGAAVDRDNDVPRIMFRVPPPIRRVSEKHYDPEVMSFGLYAYEKRDSQHSPAEKFKQVVVGSILQILMDGPHGRGSHEEVWSTMCDILIPGSEDKLRKLLLSYDDPPPSIPRSVAQMMLTVDAFFILSFLFRIFIPVSSKASDVEGFGEIVVRLKTVFSQAGAVCVENFIQVDMWLFENQIPLTLIKDALGVVFHIQKLDRNKLDGAFDGLIAEAIRNMLHLLPGCDALTENRLRSTRFGNCRHLLECLYNVVCAQRTESTLEQVFPGSASTTQPIDWQLTSGWFPRIREKMFRNRETCVIPTVSCLTKAEIDVRGHPSPGCRPHFKLSSLPWGTATLEIPYLRIDDNTEKLLRNMLVFEIVNTSNNHLATYLTCMNNLVDTEDDVKLLKQGEDPVIVYSMLGEDQDVARMFNNITQNVHVFSTKELQDIRYKINQCYQKQWRHIYIEFCEIYCKKPWIVVSLVIASIILVLTLIRTGYAVKGS